MRVVEFLGAPGSGKSTVAALLPDASGAVSLLDAVRDTLARRGEDPITRWVARLKPSSDGKLWDWVYARSTDRFSALTRFISAYPTMVQAVSVVQGAREGRDVHPEMVLEWVVNLMARYQLAGEGPADRTVVVDEGFAQRGMALVAGGYQDGDFDLLSPYLDAMPRPDVVVMVDTPRDVCEQRLNRGGWTRRLEESTPAERTGFLETAVETSKAIAARLDSAGSRVIWVSGTTPTTDSVAHIAATLTT